MSCCGSKKDVPRATQNTLRASKFYGTDNTEIQRPPVEGFRPIPKTNAGSYSKITKAEDYGVENVTGSKSRIFGDNNTLDFALDQDPGVANTFDVPTFDYQTMLSHNIYYNLNSKAQLNHDDGNRSVLKTSQPVANRQTTVK